MAIQEVDDDCDRSMEIRYGGQESYRDKGREVTVKYME